MPDAPEPNPAEKDPRVYFAAERTLLAWIRTGLALMGFGFAIARFGLFLRQLQAAQANLPVHTSWGSPLTGVTLIALGLLVNITGALQYARIVRQLSQGTWIPGRISRAGMALVILLTTLGVAMAAYLLLLH